ncbi:MAG: tetratricopeptide repeat protein, partial [bacterium]
MNIKKFLAVVLTVGMLMAAPVLAEEAPATEEATVAETAPAVVSETDIYDGQKLNAAYTLALNAISAADYETAKEYLSVCFAYCDRQTNPVMYADLLLKRACIDVIEGKDDLALLSLDAALRVQPDLADAYLVRTQLYANQGNVEASIENLEKYIELTRDTSLYETVAQLQEARGDLDAAQAAYDKYVEGAGADVEEAGFQSGLYKMEAGRFEEAIAAFEAYADDEVYAAGAQYNIGICKMNMGDYAGAIAAFTTCADKGGKFDGLYYNRGVCYLLSAEWDSAASDFYKSREVESYKDDAGYNLAICRMQQGDYSNAIVLFTALIGDGKAATEAEVDTPKAVNDGAYYYRAVCRAATGDLDGAIADYTTCIEHGYALGQTYYARADLYAAKGD